MYSLEMFNILPYKENWPYGHLAFDAFDVIKEVYEITKAKNILEIGFNAGFSSIMFLEANPSACVTSVDICINDHTIPNAELVKNKYDKRFHFIKEDSINLTKIFSSDQFDLIFIDGNHSIQYILSDIMSGLKLNIPWFLIDDFGVWTDKNDSTKIIADDVYRGVHYFVKCKILKDIKVYSELEIPLILLKAVNK